MALDGPPGTGQTREWWYVLGFAAIGGLCSVVHLPFLKQLSVEWPYLLSYLSWSSGALGGLWFWFICVWNSQKDKAGDYNK